MEKLLESIASNIIIVVAIICYTVYAIFALRKKEESLEKYQELKILNELREQGVITQDEFDEKKADLLTG